MIAPCSGVGQTVGTISRQAAYTVVDELMPGETMLLCLPAYVANVKEDVEMVERHSSKIVAIEGCGQKCVTKILRERGYEPAKTVCVSAVAAELGLRIDKFRNRARLGNDEERVVLEVARRVVEAVKGLKEADENRNQ